MARIKLIDPESTDPQLRASLMAIAGERGDVYNAYKMLANSPVVLQRLYGLTRGLWYESEIPPATQELTILRVAQLLRSDYEWGRHQGPARRAGVTSAQIESLSNWHDSDSYTDAQRAVLAVADTTSLEVAATADQIAELSRHYSAR